MASENSNNELAYLKKLDCFMFEKDGESKKVDAEESMISESSLSCGNYRGNSTGKKLSEILVDLTQGDNDFAGFLFRKSGDLKGYILYEMNDDKLIVKQLCITTPLESKREIEEDESLYSVLMEDSLTKFIESRFLDEEAGKAAAQNINTNTKADQFNPTSNFLVVLRLADVLKGDKEHFLDFDAEVPSYQIRSLFLQRN